MKVAEKYLEDRQKNILHGFTKTSKKEKTLIRHQIAVAYFTASEEISLAKFE